MKRLFLVALFLVFSAHIFAQEAGSNGEWETVALSDDISMRLPQLRDEDGNVYVELETGRAYLDVEIEERETSIAALMGEVEIDADVKEVQESNLPIGNSIHTQRLLPNTIIFNHYIPLEMRLVTVTSRIDSAASSDDVIEASNIARRVALNLYRENHMDWILFADAAGRIFLQAPASWQKTGNDVGHLIVQDTFDDVLITVQYQALGQVLTLDDLAQRHANTYAAQIVLEAGRVNLPIGDALYYHIDDIAVGDDTTHTQYQFIILRGETLIIVTAGSNSDYFDEYQHTLWHMVSTLDFREPIIGFE